VVGAHGEEVGADLSQALDNLTGVEGTAKALKE